MNTRTTKDGVEVYNWSTVYKVVEGQVEESLSCFGLPTGEIYSTKKAALIAAAGYWQQKQTEARLKIAAIEEEIAGQ